MLEQKLNLDLQNLEILAENEIFSKTLECNRKKVKLLHSAEGLLIPRFANKEDTATVIPTDPETKIIKLKLLLSPRYMFSLNTATEETIKETTKILGSSLAEEINKCFASYTVTQFSRTNAAVIYEEVQPYFAGGRLKEQREVYYSKSCLPELVNYIYRPDMKNSIPPNCGALVVAVMFGVENE